MHLKLTFAKNMKTNRIRTNRFDISNVSAQNQIEKHFTDILYRLAFCPVHMHSYVATEANINRLSFFLKLLIIHNLI